MNADAVAGFNSIYRHGFVRIVTCAPAIAIADPEANAEETLRLARMAHDDHAALVLFPELGLSGYAIEDLLHQGALQEAVRKAIAHIAAASATLRPVIIAGAPLALSGALYNCAVVIHAGAVLGVVPKSYLPNYREFYEMRHFAPAATATADRIELAGQTVPFGADLLFRARRQEDFCFYVELCEDMWAPVPPSTYGALGGATILCNLSASNITIGKTRDRDILSDSLSRRCIAAYAYSAAGHGESTTDLAWDGHLAIFEDGVKLAESERFQLASSHIAADIDLERLAQARLRSQPFQEARRVHSGKVAALRHIAFDFTPPEGEVPLVRRVGRFPYVPDDPDRLHQDCFEAYNIQVYGLVTRLRGAGIAKAVLGISGGLDSTQALLVTVKAFDLLGLPRGDILTVTMPGFATGEATKANALGLMRGLGTAMRELDIRPLATQMLKDLDHPFAKGEPVHDVTFENVQAGIRTDYLFRLANHHGGLVIGTGDLSELALGWCTYGVGDHMSHYNVNASVPKTLIQHLIRWTAREGDFGDDTRRILAAILATEISPELVPADASGRIQSTQETIGPYALHDFALYYLTRHGLKPSKIAFLAHHAWGDAGAGQWPADIDEADRVAYSLAEIKRWLEVFLFRFFTISQFKRSAVPNGPKISSGGSLSPRGDWRAPSDGNARAWLKELHENVP